MHEAAQSLPRGPGWRVTACSSAAEAEGCEGEAVFPFPFRALTAPLPTQPSGVCAARLSARSPPRADTYQTAAVAHRCSRVSKFTFSL